MEKASALENVTHTFQQEAKKNMQLSFKKGSSRTELGHCIPPPTGHDAVYIYICPELHHFFKNPGFCGGHRVDQ